MTDNVSLAERFKEKMREKNISYRGLARKVARKFGDGGPCCTTIGKILRGGYANDEHLMRITDVLGILTEEETEEWKREDWRATDMIGNKIADVLRERMAEGGIYYADIIDKIIEKYGEAVPCKATVWRILHGHASTKTNLRRVAEALGLTDEEIDKFKIAETQKLEEKKEIKGPVIDTEFRNVERFLNSAIRAIEHTKFQIQQIDKSLDTIMSFLAAKFEALQELKSNIKSMKGGLRR